MAIVLYQRPSDQNWSGNPIPYHLYSAAAEANPAIYFDIKLLFKRTDAPDYVEVLTFPWNPYKGIAKMDLQYVLDSLLEYELPIIPSDFEYSSPTQSNKATGLFYIAWREITPGEAAPDFTNTESENAKFVIKGGIAFHKWRGDNFWTNYFTPAKPFLTWQLSGRLASLTERMYLAWLNLTDVNPTNIVVRRKVMFTDGTNYTLDYPFPIAKYIVAYFPTGARQLKLDLIEPAKKIFYWELQVWDTNDNIPLSQLFRYNLDNRNDYNGITLNYRNSLGGWDSARIRGVIEYQQRREFSEIGQIALYDYFLGHAITGRVKAANSTELLIYKGDIGHLTKEEQDRLRDIHFQREVAWEIAKKWLPIMTMTGDGKLKDSESRRWTMPIEFSIASGGDRFYTPESIDLAEGVFPSTIVCNAVISEPTYTFNDPGWTVDWDLVSGAPVKYFVSTPGVSGGAPHETTDTEYHFDWLPDGDNVIKVQPLCKIGDEYILGVPQYVTITVNPSCIAVGIDGAPSLPDIEADNAYNYVINLTGTAPFSLSNVVKPPWMTIAVVGSTIELGGTPEDGNAGYDQQVSFTVSNCGGAFVNFSDAINVGPGNMAVLNLAAAGWNIDNVTPPFFAIYNGAFPAHTGETVQMTHTGYNGVISVVITAAGGPTSAATLQLKHNGALVETLPVAAAAIYNFTTRNFISGDFIQVILVP